MSEEQQTKQVDPVDEVTFWSIVWDQFKKNGMAYFGLWAIIAIVAIAVFAPVISLEYPFYVSYINEAGAQVSEFPWFTRLFDRNVFENAVDILFNLLMVLTPLMLATAVGVQRVFGGKPRKARMKLYQQTIAVWLAIITVIMIGLSLFQSSAPFKDYRKIVGEQAAASAVLAAEGKEAEADKMMPTAIFPPSKQSFRLANLNTVLTKPDLEHWLGTDNRGRDVFARLLYGTRMSLTIGVVAVSIYLTIGIILGAIAGYFRGWVDSIVLRMVEVMLCFPSFILILTLVAFVEKPSIFHVMLIIGLTRWTGPARLIRGEFLKLVGQDFVQAAIASGVPQTRVIFRHVLPNALSPVLVAATFGVAAAILIESSLSFLGLGDPSAPSWGEVLNIGRQNDNLRMILAPGLLIFITVSLFNLVGEGVRDALDPKMRK